MYGISQQTNQRESDEGLQQIRAPSRDLLDRHGGSTSNHCPAPHAKLSLTPPEDPEPGTSNITTQIKREQQTTADLTEHPVVSMQHAEEGTRRAPRAAILFLPTHQTSSMSEQRKDTKGVNDSTCNKRCMKIALFLGIVVVIAGVTAGLILGLAGRQNSDDETISCASNDFLGCGVSNWPRPGFVTFLTDCPEDESLLECGRCSIYMSESADSLDPTTDLKCNSCTVCGNNIALDCSNLIEDACGVSDCDGHCIG